MKHLKKSASKNKDGCTSEIIKILEDYSYWYVSILRLFIYPDENTLVLSAGQKLPYDGLKALDDGREIDALRELQARLAVDLEALRLSARDGKKPGVSAYDRFSSTYNEFMSYLRRVERDYIRDDNGVDSLSGLRSKNVFDYDISREQERLARDGQPFCLVLARVDHFSDRRQNMDDLDYTDLVASIGKELKETLRSFDDAYYLGNGEFLLSLKQTDNKGGKAIMLRMKERVDKVVGAQKKWAPLSLSYCAAEPFPEDEPEQILDNMRKDLNRYDQEDETALEYIEQSPLARYMQEEGLSKGKKK